MLHLHNASWHFLGGLVTKHIDRHISIVNLYFFGLEINKCILNVPMSLTDAISFPLTGKLKKKDVF